MTHTIYTTTSANRPSHEPGRLAYETDTDKIIISNGYLWHEFVHDDITTGDYSVPHVSLFEPVSMHNQQTVLDLLSGVRAETDTE